MENHVAVAINPLAVGTSFRQAAAPVLVAPEELLSAPAFAQKIAIQEKVIPQLPVSAYVPEYQDTLLLDLSVAVPATTISPVSVRQLPYFYLGSVMTAENARPGWEVGLGKRVWRRGPYFMTAGLDLRQYRFRNTRELTIDDVRFFRPGTVDTIFRNPFSGRERQVTTDTISGTLIRQFGHTNRRLEIGLPLLLGRDWSGSQSTIGITVGPRLGYNLSTSGRQIDAEGVVTDWTLEGNLRLSARAQAVYTRRLGPGALRIRVSAARQVLGADAGANWVVGTAVGYEFGVGD